MSKAINVNNCCKNLNGQLIFFKETAGKHAHTRVGGVKTVQGDAKTELN